MKKLKGPGKYCRIEVGGCNPFLVSLPEVTGITWTRSFECDADGCGVEVRVHLTNRDVLVIECVSEEKALDLLQVMTEYLEDWVDR